MQIICLCIHIMRIWCSVVSFTSSNLHPGPRTSEWDIKVCNSTMGVIHIFLYRLLNTEVPEVVWASR